VSPPWFFYFFAQPDQPVIITGESGVGNDFDFNTDFHSKNQANFFAEFCARILGDVYKTLAVL